MKLGPIEPKSLFSEFKKFAFKGNMLDLAVGVVIGAAFGGVIKSIVDHVIMPIIDYIPGLGTKNGGYRSWHLGKIEIGLVLADLLNFILVAAAVFLIIVKVIGGLQKLAHHKDAAEAVAPTTKECPRCFSTIAIKATKCPQCTADLPETPADPATPFA